MGVRFLQVEGSTPDQRESVREDYLRPRFLEHGFIDVDYTGRAGLHAFRHSLATVFITEEGVNPKTVQGQLRHATSAITMDIYAHAQGAAKRAALEKYKADSMTNTGRKSQVEK